MTLQQPLLAGKYAAISFSLRRRKWLCHGPTIITSFASCRGSTSTGQVMPLHGTTPLVSLQEARQCDSAAAHACQRPHEHCGLFTQPSPGAGWHKVLQLQHCNVQRQVLPTHGHDQTAHVATVR